MPRPGRLLLFVILAFAVSACVIVPARHGGGCYSHPRYC